MRPSVTAGSHRRARRRRRPPRWLLLLVVVVLTAGGLGGPELIHLPGPFVPDDFSGARLGHHWRVETPRGVGDVRLAATSPRHLALSVPAGVNHNAWATNDAVRVVQRVHDADLHLTAGFGSMPFDRYQMQGLTALRSAQDFVRYEVRHDGLGQRLFGSVTTAGLPQVVVDTELPELDQVHLRLVREGDQWRFEWSPDGATWSVAATFTHAMSVREAGPYAGNFDPAGNAPAFTALVDYVVNEQAAPPPTATVEPVADTTAPEPRVLQVTTHERARSVRVGWATDELTTGVVEYGLTDSYDERSKVTALGLGHGVTLTDLAPATSYHLRVVATDVHGRSVVTDGVVVTTAEDREPPLFQNDSFTELELGPHWEVVTPLGVGAVSVAVADEPGGQAADATDDAGQSSPPSGARLALHAPAGHQHHPWRYHDGVRAVQEIPDGDLTLEASFASMPAQRFQSQGLTVLESRLTFLRYEVHHDGSGLRLFASVTAAGEPTTVLDLPLPELHTVGLRVERTGDRWTLSWSEGGDAWSVVTVFSQRMVTAQMGPFVASYHDGGTPPGFTALVEAVTGSGPGGASARAPEPLAVEDVTVDASTNHVLLRWVTTRDAAAHVEYGTDGGYGEQSEPTQPGTIHSRALTGLRLGTTYHYRVVATAADGEQVTSAEGTFTTPGSNTGPTIDLWYGTEQSFGPPTASQRWFNVLGNVSDADGVSWLSYSVNGGPSRPLSIGPDQRRLQWPGDFNADIPIDELAEGDNTVTITAADSGGRTTSRTVKVHRRPAVTAGLPYTLRWQSGVPVSQQAQVVDGDWTVSEEGLRTQISGYDRLVSLGDMSWTDYELTVPVTVHELGPAAYTPLSHAPVIGVGVRWNGHTAINTAQPAQHWYPTGSFTWYRFHENGPRLEMFGTEDYPRSYGSPYFEIGVTFMLKVRVETLPGGATRYQASMWRAGEPDPGAWYTQVEYEGGPESGAVVLIAHQLHATFGDVTVTPLATPAGG